MRSRVTRLMGFIPPVFSSKPFHSRLRVRHGIDGQTDDGHRRLMPPPWWERGIIIPSNSVNRHYLLNPDGSVTYIACILASFVYHDNTKYAVYFFSHGTYKRLSVALRVLYGLLCLIVLSLLLCILLYEINKQTNRTYCVLPAES